jgi:hypothetical protein
MWRREKYSVRRGENGRLITRGSTVRITKTIFKRVSVIPERPL